MDKVKDWFAEAIGGMVSAMCWFTPAHCDYLAKIIAVVIGVVTLVFITLPKAWDFQKMRWKKRKDRK